MHWETNEMDVRYKKKYILYIGYLEKLEHKDKYDKWLSQFKLQDSLTSLKKYVHIFIYIHINDYKRGLKTGIFKLFTDKKKFRRYIMQKPYHREKAKKEGYHIFLKEVQRK